MVFYFWPLQNKIENLQKLSYKSSIRKKAIITKTVKKVYTSFESHVVLKEIARQRPQAFAI